MLKLPSVFAVSPRDSNLWQWWLCRPCYKSYSSAWTWLWVRAWLPICLFWLYYCSIRSPIKQMKRLQWVLEACPATSTEPKPCQNYKECAMMVLETKALELTWKCSRSGWMALWATALYLVSATIHPQWTAFFLLCLSRLNFKPAKAIVTTWVLVPIVSCNLMVCLPTDCIIFSHSFKFNSLIISLFLL